MVRRPPPAARRWRTAALAALAQELARESGIGPRRIFAAGLPTGGAMADALAQTCPDVFSAVGIHSGLPYAAAHDLQRPCDE